MFLYIYHMETRKKLAILADAAKYDASCASSGSKRRGKAGQLGNSSGVGICHSYTPDGRCISLLKILLTNYCIYDCKFCINRQSSDTPRARFLVEEVVSLTIEFFKRNYIEGLFLSSGIIQSADYTMEQLGEVARRLREEERFNGYIHLKAIAGADPLLVERASKYCDRLSANVELPTEQDLSALAPEKRMSTIETTMEEIKSHHFESKAERKKSRKAPKLVPAGQSTQLIVGATPSTDLDLLTRSGQLYERFKLKRVYYSAFSPIQRADPQLPPLAPPLLREHRLYQADWLMRFYDFKVEELVSEKSKDLSLQHDPKLAWAIGNPEIFPVDINKASRELLLRVPGLGVRSVQKILGTRKVRSLRLEDLKRLKVSLNKVRSFITTSDFRPGLQELPRLIRHLSEPAREQLSLFSFDNASNLALSASSALSGEL